MKKYLVMVRIRSNDPECCYDTFTTEYSGKLHRNKLDADLEELRARKESRVCNSWVEETEVAENVYEI